MVPIQPEPPIGEQNRLGLERDPGQLVQIDQIVHIYLQKYSVLLPCLSGQVWRYYAIHPKNINTSKKNLPHFVRVPSFLDAVARFTPALRNVDTK